MKFSLTTVVLGLAALGAAIPQNQNRPVPRGTCCVANTSLKQDICFTASGAQGRCVPGGANCKSFSLSLSLSLLFFSLLPPRSSPD